MAGEPRPFELAPSPGGPPLGGQAVLPAAAPSGRIPVAGHQAHVLQLVQGRVHRAFGQVQGAVAALFQSSDDGVAVPRPASQRAEQHQSKWPLVPSRVGPLTPGV